ncbi:sarcoplasmic reticulum histidine-rich calcium-binding protein-like isoform X2 [Macrobrachium nipponense]|uniref:sarcoplasmic reticulum histidine-rich calcium-binding protein-like isoform X2 n=1 Tax=Macrobrachium nipponense TaxID=159736 RepID=UPI0030C8AA8E
MEAMGEVMAEATGTEITVVVEEEVEGEEGWWRWGWRGYRGRGRGGGHRGGRPDYYHGRRKSRSPPPRQRHDHGKLLANLGPEAQLALTTALINSVLKTDGRDGRGMYRDRDRHRDGRREGRGGYFREESRERRHYGDERRSHEPRPYHEEGRGHRYEREKSASGSPRYRNNRYSGMARRKPSPHAHHGPSRKRQRLERMDSGESGSSPHHDREYEGDDSYDQERERDRQKERRHRSPGSEDSRKGREGEGGEGANDKEEGGDGPSGVQVTIKADGERAVNSEGHVRARVSGRLFVELRCPHCPSQKSITFKEYKFHLGSEGHKNQLNRLARKHSVVLRKIRVQQRQEQRDIEEKWKEEKAEEFKNAVSKFCTTCKLAYKCLGSNVSDGLSLHNRSKFHRMQRHYLHPRCSMCRITFPSRMVYEYHIASISHLRVRTAKIDNNGGEGRSDEQDQEDDDDVLDLANFMTLDSVGEDDEEVGSEHEEITEGLDEVEAAEEGSMRKKSSKGRKCGMGRDNDEISIDADWEKDNLEEDDDETEPVGMDYVTRVEAYYCSLCCKYIRGDTSLGSRCVQRHCRSFDHLAHYQDAHPPPAEEEEDADAVEKKSKSESGVGDESAEGKSYRRREEGNSEGEEGDYEGEGDYEEEEEEEEDHDDDPEQEKLWEEVDQGLAALQGEIMNENGDKANLAAGRSKDAEKEHNKNGDAEAREDSGDEDGKMEIAEREESDNDSANEEEAEMTDENKEDAEYDAKASERENELEERQEEDIESGSDGD